MADKKDKTVEEIVEYIIQHEGPGPKGRAHPEKKQLDFSLLERALNEIHSRDLLREVKPYHFKSINHIWYLDNHPTEISREVISKFIEHLISSEVYTNLNNLIENIGQDDFRVGFSELINNDEVKINTSSLLEKAYSFSPSSAILDFISNHPKLSEKYKGLGPEHFSRTQNIWKDKFGNISAKTRDVTDRFVNHLISSGKYSNLNDLIENISILDFKNGFSEDIGGHKFKISTYGILKVFGSSPFSIILDYISNKPKLSEKYKGLGPEHFPRTQNIWKDKSGNPTEKARDVTDKFFHHLISSGKYSNLNDLIKNISSKDFKIGFTECIGGHDFKINIWGMLQRAFNASPSYVILDYINSNSYLKEKYKGLGPEHLSCTPLNIWSDKIGNPTEKSRDVTARFFNRLISSGRYSNLNDLIEKVNTNDFRIGFTESIGGHDFKINMGGLFQMAFNSSASSAILDYINSDSYLKEKYKGFGPEHLSCTPQNTWSDKTGNPTEKSLDVTARFVNHLISSGKYSDLNDLIENVSSNDFKIGFTECIDGYDFKINTEGMLQRGFGSSLSYAILHYISSDSNLKQKYKGLGPEHFFHVNNLWKDNSGNISGKTREVTGRFINHLITSGKYNDLNDLIENININDFKRDFSEIINGHKFKIKMCSLLGSAFQDSYSSAILDFISNNPELNEKYKGLGPEHFSCAPQNMWVDKMGEATDKSRGVTARFVNHLISSSKYRDLNDLIENISKYDFKEGFSENVGGHKFKISTWGILKAFDSSPSSLILDYISNNPLLNEKYIGLGPEHFFNSPRNIWKDKSGNPTEKARDVTAKFVNHLISSGKYNSLNDLIENIGLNDFRNGFSEVINGHIFKINTNGMLQKAFKNSPSFAILNYISKDLGLNESYNGLGPEHFSRKNNLWVDKEGNRTKKAREVLFRFVNYLIKSGKYTNLNDLIENIATRDFKDGFSETINGYDFKINTNGLLQKAFKSSSSSAILNYIKRSKKLKQKYSWLKPIHFIGSPETRRRRMQGKFNSLDLKKIKDENGRYDTSIFGLTQFNSDAKLTVREIMVEEALDVLVDKDIHYLGLETEQFESIRHIYDNLNFSPKDSTVIERDKRTYNAMKSIQKRATNGDKKIIGDINIEKGNIQDKIYEIEGNYNFVNLDFVGHISGDKEKTIQGLFENELLDDEAIIYVTLANHARHQAWSKKEGYGEDQIKAIGDILEKHSGDDYKVSRLFDLTYTGGTNRTKKPTPMAIMGYKVNKINKENDSTE